VGRWTGFPLALHKMCVRSVKTKLLPNYLLAHQFLKHFCTRMSGSQRPANYWTGVLHHTGAFSDELSAVELEFPLEFDMVR
jgi:hypothetical protein